jgi:hypothetical protein
MPSAASVRQRQSNEADELDAQIKRLRDMVTRLGASTATPRMSRTHASPPGVGSSGQPVDFSHDVVGPISKLCIGSVTEFTASAEEQLRILDGVSVFCLTDQSSVSLRVRITFVVRFAGLSENPDYRQAARPRQFRHIRSFSAIVGRQRSCRRLSRASSTLLRPAPMPNA